MFTSMAKHITGLAGSDVGNRSRPTCFYTFFFEVHLTLDDFTFYQCGSIASYASTGIAREEM